MVAEKGHPHPRLKAARQSVKAARQMQKPRGKCKSRAANAKKCAAASILYMLYPTITWGWNLILYSIESACQSGV